jgi:DNA-directed RNA polymerase specialized sigma24 family protein
MLLTPEEERVLVLQAVGGDEGAWQRLVSNYRGEVFGAIRVRVPHEYADDILQETWIRVWKYLADYNPERAPLVAFLKQHAFWATIDFLRRRRSGTWFETLVCEFRDRHGNSEGGDPFDWISSLAESPTVPDVEAEDFEEVYNELFRITFALPNPPHELLCFGFCKILEWEPRRIAANLGREALEAIEGTLEKGCIEDSDLDAELICACFAPLRERLSRPLGSLISDQRTRQRYRQLLERMVGRTALHEYFSSAPTDDISHWWYSVRRRFLEAAARKPSPELGGLLDRIFQQGLAKKQKPARMEKRGYQHG